MEEAYKNSLVPAAAELFPEKIFREWLRVRLGAADVCFPEWRGCHSESLQILMLDLAFLRVSSLN